MVEVPSPPSTTPGDASGSVTSTNAAQQDHISPHAPLQSPTTTSAYETSSETDRLARIHPAIYRPNSNTETHNGGSKRAHGSTEELSMGMSSHGYGSQKRPRTMEDDETRSSRTITLDVLRDNAIDNPRNKQQIERWPKDSDQFWVFRCKEHNLLFGLGGKGPCRGAIKHLISPVHVKIKDKTGARAVKEFGHRVLGCDQERMDRHNRGERSERARSEKSPSRGPCEDKVEMRAVGELCRMWYEPERSFYAVVVLPVGDFSPLGMAGTLSLHTDLTDEIPNCYQTCNNQIVGWAEGYEDGGSLVEEREYPVLYLEGWIEFMPDGDLDNPKGQCYAWVAAWLLKTFSLTDSVSESKTVEAYLKRMENLNRTGTLFTRKHSPSRTCQSC